MTAETDRYSQTRNNGDEMKTEVNSISCVLMLGGRTRTMGTWGYTTNATSTS